MRMIRWAGVGAGFVAAGLGCGGGGAGTAAGGGTAAAAPGTPAAPAGKAAAKPWDAAAGSVTLTVTAGFTGAAPKRRPVDMSRETTCHEHHKGAVLDESVLVNANGTLKNVFVWVRSGLEGWSFTPPTTAVVLDQHWCTYAPHVAGLQVGQPLTIRNSDSVMHNVHSFPKRNTDLNVGQGTNGAENTVRFERAEVMIPFKCDVHGWMGAFLGVVAHPFFAVTADDGAVTLPKLPPGTYVVEAWHEVYGAKQQTVTVAAGETKALTFGFEDK